MRVRSWPGPARVQAELVQEIKSKGLSGEVAVLETGNLGVTGMGVVLVVYPEGLYYANITKEDVPEFVEEQLLKGRLVKRLLLTQAPKRFIIRREKTGLTKEQPRVVLKNCGFINPESIEEYIAAGGYEGGIEGFDRR